MRHVFAHASLSALRRCGPEVAGTAGIEFALVLPILLTLMFGSVEAFRMVWMMKKTVQVANVSGELVSDTQTPLAASDLQFVSDAGMIIAPQVLSDARRQGVAWTSILQSSFASVVFSPTVPGCLVACTYTANVAWSAGPQRRACGQLTAAPDNAPTTATTLPQSLFSTGSVIVVDTQYNYRPVFASSTAFQHTFTRSAFFVPRYLSQIKLGNLSANPSLATQCPGY